MYSRIAIAGGGQAAVQAVDTLRRKGFTGTITLVGDEPWLPYQRPPLSKKYLAGALARERLFIRPERFFTEHGVELHLGRRVAAIRRREQRLELDDGAFVAYDALLIATGSRPRTLPLPGADLAGVHVLRTLADTDRVRTECVSGHRLVIIGGGYIGLEVAASARGLGLEVTVLEMTDRVMNRVTCAQVSEFYAREHARRGVRIVCSARVSALGADPHTGRVRTVLTADGEEHAADAVIVAVGVAPVDELAAAAGLACADGILIDEYCRTADPAIYAAGDCVNFPSPHYGRRVRLESVDNAFEQATTAALNLLGTPTVHDKVPWFWSDQYDLKLIIVGLSHGFDAVVMRGDPHGHDSSATQGGLAPPASPATSGTPPAHGFSVCYLRDGELIALDSVNSPRDQMAARKLIASHARPDVNKLADPAVALKDCV